MNVPHYTVFMLAAGCLAGAASAEIGVGAGASFAYEASFSSDPVVLDPAADPGSVSAGSNHFYDNGYNLVDSSGNFGGKTTFWGYEETAQYDPAGDGGNGTITLESSYSTINAGRSTGESDGAQPALEAYWRSDLAGTERWKIGFRAALRWQHIEVDAASAYGTMLTAVSDEYALGGVIPPTAPFSGSYAGPNALLGDTPVRTITAAPGAPVQVRQSAEADLIALDLGSSLALYLSDRWSAVISAGPTLAWIRNDYSYSSALSGSYSDTDSDMLLGAYAAADLQYRIAERSGLYVGVAQTALQNYSQQTDGHEAGLEFNDSYTYRIGLFFR